jgi:hypothetical protein
VVSADDVCAQIRNVLAYAANDPPEVSMILLRCVVSHINHPRLPMTDRETAPHAEDWLGPLRQVHTVRNNSRWSEAVSLTELCFFKT